MHALAYNSETVAVGQGDFTEAVDRQQRICMMNR